MKKRMPGLLLVIAAAAVLIFASWQIAEVGDNLQYVTDAPALVVPSDGRQKAGAAVTSLQEDLESAAEDWSASVRAWTLGGVIQQTALSGGGRSASGRLELLGENAFAAHPRFLLHGRLFYEDELSKGEKVILLDEQMALALFAVADPIDRTVAFNGVDYRVVGVLRHSKQVGDYTDYGACIPLNSVLAQNLQMDALVVEADPIPGAGAGVAFSGAVKAWRAGGTVIDLGKEGEAARLWLRVLLFAVGAAMLMRYIRFLNEGVRKGIASYKRRLRTTYASRLFPRLASGTVLLGAGYLLAAAAAAALMQFIIQPVYTFPEWVPTVLVEWDDVSAAFWNVWQAPATVIEYRTPELLRLRFFTLITQAGAAVAGAGCALWFGMGRARKTSLQESLRMMAGSGVVASRLQTADPSPLEEMGYVPCEGGAMRIISVRRALELMPPSAREGAFVIAVEDPWIPENNCAFRITCAAAGNTVRETGAAYDIRTPISTLTEMMYGGQKFEKYLESHVDFDLRLRSPAMEGFFSHHLTIQ